MRPSTGPPRFTAEPPSGVLWSKAASTARYRDDFPPTPSSGGVPVPPSYVPRGASARPASSTARTTAALNEAMASAMRCIEEEELLKYNAEQDARRRASEAAAPPATAIGRGGSTRNASLTVALAPRPPPLRGAASQANGQRRIAHSAPERSSTATAHDSTALPELWQQSELHSVVDDLETDANNVGALSGGGPSQHSREATTQGKVPLLPLNQLIHHELHASNPEAWSHREALEAQLHRDKRLGYGRRVVPVALVQARINTMMKAYRDNKDGARDMLAERLRETQQERATQRGSRQQELIQTAVDEATRKYQASHHDSKDVPYAVLLTAREEALRDADSLVKSRTSPDALRHRNEQRLRDHRERLAVVDAQRREELLQSAHRHEDFVAAAAEQRQREEQEQLCATWHARATLFKAQKSFQSCILNYRTFQHLVSYHDTLQSYWAQWAAPAAVKAQERRRMKLKGALRYALCAARLLAYHVVRKRHVGVILTLVSMQQASQRFIAAVHRYVWRIRIGQRAVRRLLAMRHARMVILLMQWDAVEADMRQPNFSPLLGKCIAVDDTAPTTPQLMSSPKSTAGGQVSATAAAAAGRRASNVPTAGGGLGSGRRASNVSAVAKAPPSKRGSTKGAAGTTGGAAAPKTEDVMASELTSKDKVEVALPIPFDVRAEAVKRLFDEHQRRFFGHDQSRLFRADEEEYARAVQLYRQLPLRKQTPANCPKQPTLRKLPLFIRRGLMIQAIQPYLDTFRALIHRLKMVAARDAVRANLHFDYLARREAYTQLLYVNEETSMLRFELEMHVPVPRFVAAERSVLVAAMDAKNDAMSSMILAQSPRNHHRSEPLEGSRSISRSTLTLHSPVHSGPPDEMVSSKADEIVARRYPGDAAFAALAKHIQFVYTPAEAKLKELLGDAGGNNSSNTTAPSASRGSPSRGNVKGPPRPRV